AGRQRCQAPYALLQRDQLLVAHIVTEETGEGSISARMWVRVEKDALRRSRVGVRTDADPFLLHLLANVLLRHEEVHGPDPAAVLYNQVDRRFLRRGSALLGDF